MIDLEAICPRYHRAVELIGARWNGAIVRAVLDGRHRYADIKAVIPGVGDTMLAQRLKSLEAEDILERRVVPTAPVRIEYHLTPKGAALAPAVEALKAWAHEWLPVPQELQNASRAELAGKAVAPSGR
jgi:DNA-binding HxlR family transcriptional regulator